MVWEQCGKPKGEQRIQNIKKRGFKLRTAPPPESPVAAAPVAAAPVVATPGPGPGKGKPAKGFRLTPAQRKVAQEAQTAAKVEYGKQFAARHCRVAATRHRRKHGQGF